MVNHSFYFPSEFEKYISDIERLAMAKGLSKNKMVLFILKDWIDGHRRYMDMKITDFEQVVIEEIKREADLKPCFYCGSVKYEGDSRIHLDDCQLIKWRRKALEEAGEDGV